MGIITRNDVHLIVAIFLGSLMAVQAWDVSSRDAFSSSWGTTPAGGENMQGITDGIFGQWVVPFEVLSVLLLVALVGAVAMAMREKTEADR